jgi:outer membrane murein-binding lipoprotein Lpp
MMLKRTRTAGTAAALVSGALLLAGCSGGQGAMNTASAPQNPGADTARSDSDPASGSGNVSASNCSAQDFKIDLNAQPGKPGAFLLAMTNNSDKACELGGWVDLTPTDAKGEPTDVPMQNVEVPGPPEDLTLEPGKTAFAGVQTEQGSKADADAKVATGFTAKPSNMDGEINANVINTRGSSDEPIELPIKSLKVGTLQPTSQGVFIG